jgi:hypothetical protein
MIYKPPMNIAKRDRERKSVFLAGSIEMGKAEDWQKKLEGICDDFGYDVLNPRRDDWDSSWTILPTSHMGVGCIGNGRFDYHVFCTRHQIPYILIGTWIIRPFWQNSGYLSIRFLEKG